MRSRGVVEETAINREAGRIIRGYFADPANPSQPLLDNDGNKIQNNIQITTNDFFFNGFPGAETDVYDAIYEARDILTNILGFETRDIMSKPAGKPVERFAIFEKARTTIVLNYSENIMKLEIIIITSIDACDYYFNTVR